jgi:hypothetical protein
MIPRYGLDAASFISIDNEDRMEQYGIAELLVLYRLLE